MIEASSALVSRRSLIRNGLLFVTNCVWTPWAFGSALATSGSSNVDDSGRSWVIDNGLISRTVTFQPKVGLFTERLSDLSTRADYILPATIRMEMAQEFSFSATTKPAQEPVPTSAC